MDFPYLSVGLVEGVYNKRWEMPATAAGTMKQR
jgi:hypothetical protein